MAEKRIIDYKESFADKFPNGNWQLFEECCKDTGGKYGKICLPIMAYLEGSEKVAVFGIPAALSNGKIDIAQEISEITGIPYEPKSFDDIFREAQEKNLKYSVAQKDKVIKPMSFEQLGI